MMLLLAASAASARVLGVGTGLFVILFVVFLSLLCCLAFSFSEKLPHVFLAGLLLNGLLILILTLLPKGKKYEQGPFNDHAVMLDAMLAVCVILAVGAVLLCVKGAAMRPVMCVSMEESGSRVDALEQRHFFVGEVGDAEIRHRSGVILP
ncbi:unnamed protein product [Vitrella brassicaformis CCMP3155]|uniref:Uncharacterized protein n=1 Tax=Vitrella brassicaformis (strain CCMP3155) TaxID=1169540 RepID=A0A0G4GRN8_VITBC|nr:unnamed protein product [Vitrella brassicaformis CCMP3155]|eukprot:CEM33232.1 unnamed protein product [Vitrella brassicaformis CCMP3155]